MAQATIEAQISLDALLQEIRSCRTCEKELPLGPNPIICAAETSRLLIISQAPGTRVHYTGIPFNDTSGDRLRQWLLIDRATFYDESRIAIMPMGMCYPGRNIRGGDLPPCSECAPLWHEKVRILLPQIRLTLLVGGYAQRYYLRNKLSLTETVRTWRSYLPAYFPLPHPSWRNNAWLKNNPWFEEDLLPELRRKINSLLSLSFPSLER